MTLVGLPFANTFAFARPSAAPLRNAAGALVEAAVDEARFDHDEAGARTGLLIEPGSVLGQQDRLSTVSGDWSAVPTATVLLEWADPAGAVHRRATYSRQVKATVDGALATTGHLRFVAAVAGFLPRQTRADGTLYVRFRDKSWELGAAIVDGTGVALADSEGRLLIEST